MYSALLFTLCTINRILFAFIHRLLLVYFNRNVKLYLQLFFSVVLWWVVSCERFIFYLYQYSVEIIRLALFFYSWFFAPFQLLSLELQYFKRNSFPWIWMYEQWTVNGEQWCRMMRRKNAENEERKRASTMIAVYIFSGFMRYHIVEHTSFSCIFLFHFSFYFPLLWSYTSEEVKDKRNCLNFILLRIPTLVQYSVFIQQQKEMAMQWESTFPFSILFIRWILNICLFTITLPFTIGSWTLKTENLGGSGS